MEALPKTTCGQIGKLQYKNMLLLKHNLQTICYMSMELQKQFKT